MNMTEESALQQVRPACPSCAAANTESTKYCSSCGAALWEDCSSCNHATRIGQTFCGGCGHSLAADLERRLQDGASRLALAREAFARFEFDQAILIAKRVIRPDDPRFAHLSDEAGQLVEESQRANRQWQAMADGVRDAAEQAAVAHDFEAVVRLLSPIPEPVLGDALNQRLAVARARLKSIGDLSAQLRCAIEARDLVTAGRLVDDLLELRPGHKEYAALAMKIGRALLASAERRFQKGLHPDALVRLDAMPEMAREAAEYVELRSRIEDVGWLVDQTARSPFATPELARLAKRLVQTCPAGEGSARLLDQLKSKIQSHPQDRHSLYPTWRREPTGWAGTPVGVLNRPQQITGSQLRMLQQHPTRFAVAIGLALQGLGLGSFNGQLTTAPAKAGLKQLLSRPIRPTAAWGVDAGASAIRAVRLERAGDGVRIAEAWMLPFDQPLCRTSLAHLAPTRLQQGLEELAAKMNPAAETPLWANVSARETLGRFLALPPAADRQLAAMVQHEITSGFPLAAAELCVAHAITNATAGGARRAIVVAARRDRVGQREQAFKAAGLKLSGLQADPVALHHYAQHELRERFLGDQAGDDAPEAIVLIDGGASGTTFYMATRDCFWFRFVDGGGEELTTRLATACGITSKAAEGLKMNVATIDSLPAAMQAVEGQMRQSFGRLDQHYRKATEFFGPVRLKQIFCTGGTPLMHGWVRHALHTTAGT